MKRVYYYCLYSGAAGMFSEINQIVYFILYSQMKGIPFYLNTQRCVFSEKVGWLDYFNSLHSEHNPSFHTSNIALSVIKHLDQVRLRRMGGFLDWFLDEGLILRHRSVFKRVRNEVVAFRKNERDLFLQKAHAIISNIWSLNDDTRVNVDSLIKGLNLPQSYITVHIRRGDKVKEASSVSVQRFVDQILTSSVSTQTIFVMTDDYQSCLELRDLLPENFEIVTLCKTDCRGNDQATAVMRSKKIRRNAYIQLIAEVEIARQSEIFIGDFSSNVARAIQYLRLEHCYNVGCGTFEDL